MKAGDKIPTLAGTMATVPYANEHPCFGQRQGYCKNVAAWRMETVNLILHWCDECKTRPNVQKFDGQWTKMEERVPRACGDEPKAS